MRDPDDDVDRSQSHFHLSPQQMKIHTTCHVCRRPTTVHIIQNPHKRQEGDYKMATYNAKLTDLMAMGYGREQATKALDISDGDVEQAIGFLLLGDESQRGFDVGSILEDSFRGSLRLTSGFPSDSSSSFSARERRSHAGGSSTCDTSSVVSSSAALTTIDEDYSIREIMKMGYTKQLASEALSISGGDLNQAVSFLLMGESKSGFLITERQRSDSEDADAALATALQREELEQMQSPPIVASIPAPALSVQDTSAATRLPADPANNPRMVATRRSVDSFPTNPSSTIRFVSCVFASQFLRGGTVNSSFLDSALRAGFDMMQREQQSESNNGDDWSIGKILQTCGKLFLGIATIVDERRDEPKQGVFINHDLSHSLGIRKILATCRNEQKGTKWQVLVLDSGDQSFCICLPPKGSANKFWYFDAKKR